MHNQSCHLANENSVGFLLVAILQRHEKASIFTARRYAERRICYGNSVRPSVRLSSVCLSVRLSVTRVDQSKTAEGKIMQFSPYSSSIPLVFAR